jgi:hypothetical protein
MYLDNKEIYCIFMACKGRAIMTVWIERGKIKGAMTEFMYHLFTTFLGNYLIYLTHFCACLNKDVMVWL